MNRRFAIWGAVLVLALTLFGLLIAGGMAVVAHADTTTDSHHHGLWSPYPPGYLPTWREKSAPWWLWWHDQP